MKTEPAQIVGWLTAAITAVLALLVAFGVHISQDQRTAILGVLAAIAPIVAAYAIRSQVFSQTTTQRLVSNALQQPTPVDPDTAAKEMVKK